MSNIFYRCLDKRVLLLSLAVSLSATILTIPLGASNYPSDITAIHRFYNKKGLTHFYTASENEANSIKKNMSATYRYEGISYYGYQGSSSERQALHRFYNKVTGTHFYTISNSEAQRIQVNMSNKFRYEGVKYYVNKTNTSTSTSVFRFFNIKTGTHFYTASSSEANRLKRTQNTYRYEGAAFPAIKDRYFTNCTDARQKDAAPIYRHEPGYRLELDRDRDGIACEL